MLGRVTICVGSEVNCTHGHVKGEGLCYSRTCGEMGGQYNLYEARSLTRDTNQQMINSRECATNLKAHHRVQVRQCLDDLFPHA